MAPEPTILMSRYPPLPDSKRVARGKGEGAGPALGLARGVFEITAAAENIGLAIEGIVANPASAPMEILNALTFGRSKTTEEYAGLASAERALTSDDLSDIGTAFKDDKDKLASTLKRGCFSK
ncbi:hypothetical protein IFR05_004531 [Cadophora sp. M221]|nr:hypothetical protein IFR05_004531 [Cadophora sp. M221]